MKNCQSCCHYGCVKSEDKLNPDKTVTKAKIQYEFCNKGRFYLTDHNPCELYEEGKRSARIMPPPNKERLVTLHENEIVLPLDKVKVFAQLIREVFGNESKEIKVEVPLCVDGKGIARIVDEIKIRSNRLGRF